LLPLIEVIEVIGKKLAQAFMDGEVKKKKIRNISSSKQIKESSRIFVLR
jgi:hypothetical protein